MQLYSPRKAPSYVDTSTVQLPGTVAEPVEGAAAGLPRLAATGADKGRGHLCEQQFPEVATTNPIQDGPDRASVLGCHSVLFCLNSQLCLPQVPHNPVTHQSLIS